MNQKYEANVQKDLSEWQEQHALLILSRVKVDYPNEPLHSQVSGGGMNDSCDLFQIFFFFW